MPHPRFQFSIRWMFAVTMVVAAGAGLWVATPSWQLGVVELVLIFFVPAFSAVASQNSTGYAKAFWIGVLVSGVLRSLALFMVLFPHGNWAFVNGYVDMGEVELALMGFFAALARYGRFMVVFWSLGPLVGILCVVGRWLLGKKE
jgi:hypothetical protein